MKNLGLKPERELCECGPVTSCAHRREIEYPTAYLTAEQMPELYNLEAGDEAVLSMKVRIRSVTKRETLEGMKCDGSIELLAYKVHKETE